MKQVIVVNQQLRLPTGKLAAQVAHAAVAAFLSAPAASQRTWLEAGMPKIVLAGMDVETLVRLEEAAKIAGLPYCLIHDAGKTVVEEGTITCLGIGPALPTEIDVLTGTLRLL